VQAVQDLHELPKIRDSLSYIFIEHAIIERDQHAVKAISQEGVIPIPAASLAVLMLGPGTSITHAAVKVLAEAGCSILWTASDGDNFYAQGSGETRKAYHLIRQAELVSDPLKREQVVLRMYEHRFGHRLDEGLSLPQIRGMEGVRVRTAYQQASRKYKVAWSGRRYDRSDWANADPLNRALSAANALLNGVCHAAIVSGGYSPGLGFVHTGKQLSFVYDIADLYKVELTIPTAFEIVAQSSMHVESRARQACREKFRETRLMQRLLPDIDSLLQIEPEPPASLGDVDSDPAMPELLWEPLLEGGGAG
jgi:CRISPR-associated protein Cas1